MGLIDQVDVCFGCTARFPDGKPILDDKGKQVTEQACYSKNNKIKGSFNVIFGDSRGNVWRKREDLMKENADTLCDVFAKLVGKSSYGNVIMVDGKEATGFWRGNKKIHPLSGDCKEQCGCGACNITTVSKKVGQNKKGNRYYANNKPSDCPTAYKDAATKLNKGRK